MTATATIRENQHMIDNEPVTGEHAIRAFHSKFPLVRKAIVSDDGLSVHYELGCIRFNFDRLWWLKQANEVIEKYRLPLVAKIDKLVTTNYLRIEIR